MNAVTHDLFSDAWLPPAAAFGAGHAVPLAMPAADRPLACAWRDALQRLTRAVAGHSLHPERARRYAAQTVVSDALRARWQAVFPPDFAADASGTMVHAQGAVQRLQDRLFADVGIDRSHLLHLHHRAWHPRAADPGAPAIDQRLHARLVRTVRVGRASVLLIVETTVVDAAGDPIALLEDGFVARRLGIADVVRAGDDAMTRRAVARLRRRVAELQPDAAGMRVSRWLIDAEACRAFGALLGEAPWSGLAGPAFVQAAHLRHLVVHALQQAGSAIERLTMTFVGRAHVGQTLRCLQSGERFEVIDASGRLIAFGTC
jgi:hypothetical protein